MPYVLKDKAVIWEPDILKWAEFIAHVDERSVAKTQVASDISVSTVFIGISKDCLFETMVFGGLHDGEQRRCSTWKDAESNHVEVVDFVKESLGL